MSIRLHIDGAEIRSLVTIAVWAGQSQIRGLVATSVLLCPDVFDVESERRSCCLGQPTACAAISGLIAGVPPASLVLAAIFPRRSGPYVANQQSHAPIVGGVAGVGSYAYWRPPTDRRTAGVLSFVAQVPFTRVRSPGGRYLRIETASNRQRHPYVSGSASPFP